MQSNKLIYILDDSPEYRDVLNYVIKKDIPRVTTEVFDDVDDLLESISVKLPDVLIIDFMLRDEKSPRIIRKIRKLSSDMLIISISSCEDPKELISTVKAGSSNFCPKKDFNRIVRMMKTHLKIRSNKGEKMSDIMALYKEQAQDELRVKLKTGPVPMSSLLHETIVDGTFNGENLHKREEQVASI